MAWSPLRILKPALLQPASSRGAAAGTLQKNKKRFQGSGFRVESFMQNAMETGAI